ncbi:MAG: adenylyl-sulfate kinase [Burkholderiaceae bacterium]
MRTQSGARCYWFTGLPGAGKTTLANHLHQALMARGIASVVLDGDLLRQGLNRDLGFTREDRRENLRRMGEVSRLMVDAGLVVLVAAISPYDADRQAARQRFAEGTFFEVYVATDLATCMERDPKGLYALAQAGKITHLTGWDDPYERPMAPDFEIHTVALPVEEACALLVLHASTIL